MTKRLLSVVLAALMIFALAPMGVFARTYKTEKAAMTVRDAVSVTYTGESKSICSPAADDTFTWDIDISENSSTIGAILLVDYDEDVLECIGSDTLFDGGIVAAYEDDEGETSAEPSIEVREVYEGATGDNPYGEEGNTYAIVLVYSNGYDNGGIQLGGGLARLTFKWKSAPAAGAVNIPVTVVESYCGDNPRVEHNATVVPGVITVLDHAWGAPTYEWAADHSTCTATRVCANDATHVESETVAPEVNMVPPTCTEAGTVTYTATFTNTAFETQTVTVPGDPANGHDWNDPEYEWSEDNLTCTASVVCKIDISHIETETVATSYEIITPATYEAPGLGRYTATFENELFTTQTKDVPIPQLEPQGYHIIVDNRTNNVASTSIDPDALYSGEVTFTVTANLACAVAIVNGEDSYTRLTCTTVGEEHQFTVTVTDADVNIVVVVRGDVNFDGKVKPIDASIINQCAVGNSTLNALRVLSADYILDGKIKPIDASKAKQVAAGNQSYDW